MSLQPAHINEEQAAIAFNKQSVVFDELYAANTIIQYKRSRVREHALKYLKPHSNILELNAGTGDDAVFFARQGHHVHATDISTGMQEKLREKVIKDQLTGLVSNEVCSFTELGSLKNKGPYDLIFSNFAGLNCTAELEKVLHSFEGLLKPGGMVTLVMLPKFCLWETLLVFKGKFKTAGRRFFSSKGRKAHIDGHWFTCWYYSPKFILQHLKDKYRFVEIEGLCTIVPPSYIENFAERHPKLYSFLTAKENKLKNKWPWKYVGDYFIITLRKVKI
ncbi:MAG: class I SAM-dependent methyltransferase [Ferruginibacter sp.]